MWVERGTNLFTLLALVAVIAGLLVLALPDTMEGRVLVQWDAAHSLREADLIGLALVAGGALVIWTMVLAWQRRRTG